MELFGIILSIPAALFASTIYVIFIKWLTDRRPSLTTPILVGSTAVLGLFAAEAVLLVTVGAIQSRENIGPVFFGFHFLTFILGVPSLANMLALRVRARTTLTVALCTVFAFVLVLLQYGITEALYGVEGNEQFYGGE